LGKIFQGEKRLKGIIYLYDISAIRIGGMSAKVSSRTSQSYPLADVLTRAPGDGTHAKIVWGERDAPLDSGHYTLGPNF
jgi:hypothetical protein